MKYLPLIFAGLILSSCEMVSERQTAVQLCEQTVYDYARLRDEGPAEDYADLFIEAGRFTLGPNVTEGREALIARHIHSNEAAIWRHHMLAVDIREEQGVLTGKSRFLIYTAPHPAPAKNPRVITGDYLDEFVIENDRCKIVSRSVQIIFDS